MISSRLTCTSPSLTPPETHGEIVVSSLLIAVFALAEVYQRRSDLTVITIEFESLVLPLPKHYECSVTTDHIQRWWRAVYWRVVVAANLSGHAAGAIRWVGFDWQR